MSARLDQFAMVMHSASMAIERAVIGVVVYLACMTGAGAFELVTNKEAALPDDKTGIVRGLTRGPEVIFVSPRPTAGLVNSPLELKIRFKAHGGAQIDRDSIVVTYKKVPAVDMTQRLTPYINADGIDVVDAEVPAGTHRFRIDVKDTEGRSTTDFLLITVEK